MYKCEFHGCGRELSVEKREVTFLRIQRGTIVTEKGEKFIDWDGYRAMCIPHKSQVLKKRLPRNLDLIYGKRKQSRE